MGFYALNGGRHMMRDIAWLRFAVESRVLIVSGRAVGCCLHLQRFERPRETTLGISGGFAVVISYKILFQDGKILISHE